MAKIQLRSKVHLDFTGDGEDFGSFDITFQEPTRKQQKALGADNKAIMDLFKKSQSMDRQIKVITSKLSAQEELEKVKEVEKTAEKLLALVSKRDALEDDFEELGGIDQVIEASRDTFEVSVGGKDKQALIDFIDEYSDFSTVLEAIAEDVKEQKGK